MSNTFATALWGPDALFELVQAGVESASVDVRANAINMAFSLTRNGLVANPLLYGMVLFSKTLGPGAPRSAAALRPPLSRSPVLPVGVIASRTADPVLAIDTSRLT